MLYAAVKSDRARAASDFVADGTTASSPCTVTQPLAPAHSTVAVTSPAVSRPSLVIRCLLRLFESVVIRRPHRPPEPYRGGGWYGRGAGTPGRYDGSRARGRRQGAAAPATAPARPERQTHFPFSQDAKSFVYVVAIRAEAVVEPRFSHSACHSA
ncbi:hypothetical protein GCM10010327_15120 [Streptomyces nitrosporeus]|nr:hypothetical protein GCM10010327_15120 [Streptomyces nitrosporeus]